VFANLNVKMIKLFYDYKQCPIDGFSYFTFFLDEKSNKKIKTDGRFARKTFARRTEISQTPPFGRQTGIFLRPPHLFFGSPAKVNPCYESEC